jgi:ABC-2 type transport system ATP-binding protein
MHTVEIEGVTKTFGTHKAVDDLSLAVPKGSIYGFIGPNGSGKTTTLRMIMNIFYPDSGSISVFGEPVHGSHTDRIGYLKVRQLLMFYGQLKGGKNLKREIDQWLIRFELAPWADKNVETLSKGMSQKVQFIAAVIAKPEMLILDEPFSGLDPVNAEVIKDSVLEMRANGTTIIFSTHDMSTAERLCDFIFMIFKGKKVLDGTLSSIQDQYGSDTIRIRIDGDGQSLHDMPGVVSALDYGHYHELRIQDGYDSQQILSSAMSKGRVTLFELARPSLQDIFVRIAAPSPEEITHA